MPIEKLTPTQAMVGKIDRVTGFQRWLKGKTFGIEYDGGRNLMAKVVVFHVGFLRLLELVKEFSPELTAQEIAKATVWLNFLIDVWTGPESQWELFWKGEQFIKPQDYSLLQDIDGQEVPVDLTQMTFISFSE